jgi:acyl dehydratase
VSALGFDRLRMLSPARPGDRLSLHTETLAARRSNSRPDCGIVESRSDLVNQHGETVMSYLGAFLVQCRDVQATAAGE